MPILLQKLSKYMNKPLFYLTFSNKILYTENEIMLEGRG